MIEPSAREPADVDAADIVTARPLDVAFPGFRREAFAMMRLLRMRPRLTTYQAHRARFDTAVMRPFRMLRDDLVANWVVPSRLRFETERNVFSRVAKNDFGRGGANHRIWMAFYRPEYRRLTDVQLLFALCPNGFTIGSYCPDNPGGRVNLIRSRLCRDDDVRTLEPELTRAAEVAVDGGFALLAVKGGVVVDVSPPETFDVLRGATAWRLKRTIARPDVESLGAGLVEVILRDLTCAWPFHRLMLSLARN